MRWIKEIYANWLVLRDLTKLFNEFRQEIALSRIEFNQLEKRVDLYASKANLLENTEARLVALEVQHNRMHDELMHYRELAAFGDLPGQKDDAA